MIDEGAALLALRARGLTVSVATTGTMSLSATTTGYARAAGSFITDGFIPGMEITPAGFSANTVDIITGVSALALTTLNARTAEASAGSRSIAVALPSVRAWELKDTSKETGAWMVREELIPGPSELKGQKNGGLVREIGLYVLTLYGPEKYGPLAMRKLTGALKALYAPGTTLTAGSHTLRVRTDSSVYAGQIIPQGDGHARCVLTVPYEAYSINAIAA